MKAALLVKRIEALDDCHQQVQANLETMAGLIDLLQTDPDSPKVRPMAKAVEAFFSGTSRVHHIEEERTVFPGLLASGEPELVQAVRTLQQDHRWIEQNWLELSPMLCALARGEGWPDLTSLTHQAQVFLNLCLDHILLEETLIYPEAKARLLQELQARAARLSRIA